MSYTGAKQFANLPTSAKDGYAEKGGPMYSLLNILLIEDEALDAQRISHALATEPKFTVTTVSDGAAALTLLREQKIGWPYLILLDLVLPNLDGFAFLQELRSDARLRTTIVFVLTASTADKNKRRAYSLGIAGYLVKTALPQLRALLAAYSDIIEFPENISE